MLSSDESTPLRGSRANYRSVRAGSSDFHHGSEGVRERHVLEASSSSCSSRGSRESDAGDSSAGEEETVLITDRAHAVRLATLYVRAAMFDRRIDHKTDPRSIDFVELYYESTAWSLVRWLALWSFFIITFFEDPGVMEPTRQWIIFLVELGCVMVLCASFAIRVRFTKLAQLFRSPCAVLHAVALTVALVDMICSWVHYDKHSGFAYFRYARMVRPLLLLEYQPAVRRRTQDILKTFYRVRAALTLLTFQIAFFAVISMFLFFETKEGEKHFASLGDSMVTLTILISTCNSPRVFLPAFTDNKLSVLYFVFFLIVSVFFMLNLVLAVVYNEHRWHLKREARRLTLRKRVCTSAAYRVLLLFSHTLDSGVEGSRQQSDIDADQQPLESAFASCERNNEGVPSQLVVDLLMRLGVRHPNDAARFAHMMTSSDGGASDFSTTSGNGPVALENNISRDSFEDILLIVYVIAKGLKVDHLDMGDSAEDPLIIETGQLQPLMPFGILHDEYEDRIEDSDAPLNLSNELTVGEALEQSTSNQRPEDSMLISVDHFDVERYGVPWGCCGLTVRTSATGSRRLAIKIVMHSVWLGRRWGYTKTLDLFINTLLLVSGIVTFFLIALYPVQILHEDPPEYAAFNTVCSVLFLMEIGVRIHAVGSDTFFSVSYWNVFEAVIVAVSVLGVVTQFSKLTFFVKNHHLFLFLRKLRLLRLLRSVPQFRLLMEILGYLVPTLFTFGRVILVFMYCYAILGMGFLGHVRLPADEYFANDFRSFPLSLLTLFELMVVNDWNATMASFKKATGNPNTQIFFVVWYGFAVIVLLNSVTSFALEALDLHITHSAMFKEAQQHNKEIIRADSNDRSWSLGDVANFAHVDTCSGSNKDTTVVGSQPSPPRELRRSMSLVQRVRVAKQVGKVAKHSTNIFDMLHEVFNSEIDEPTAAEVDDELRRMSLNSLSFGSR